MNKVATTHTFQQVLIDNLKEKAFPSLLIVIVLGTFLSIGSLYLFIEIAEKVLSREISTLDNAISAAIYSWRNPMLTSWMYFFSLLGGEFAVLAATLATGVLAWKKTRKEAMLFAFIIITGYILNSVMKYILHVPRPNIDPLYTAKFYSFPSGHAMNSFIFYASLSYFIFKFTKSRVVEASVLLLSVLIIFLIGLSRVYLGVHFPSDVIAGYVAGFWWVTTAILIDKTKTFYRVLKSKSPTGNG